jgi:2-keto-4-pentenoate hydratase
LEEIMLNVGPLAPWMEEAADLIAAGRRDTRTIGDLPESCRLTSYDQIYPIMEMVHDRLNWQTVGWKVGAASKEIQGKEGLPGPAGGRIYAHGLHESPATLGERDFIKFRLCESEFMFRLARDLPPRAAPYTREEITEAVDLLYPVIEIGDSVFANWYESTRYFGPPADNVGGAHVVRGKPTADWRGLDLPSHPIELWHNGKYVRTGRGEAAMGHPLESFAWMANLRSRMGDGLKAGEYVSTGTCTGHLFAQRGDVVKADFGPLGVVQVTFA